MAISDVLHSVTGMQTRLHKRLTFYQLSGEEGTKHFLLHSPLTIFHPAGGSQIVSKFVADQQGAGDSARCVV